MINRLWTYNILERRTAGVFCAAQYETLAEAIDAADRLQASADRDAPTNADGRAISTYVIYYYLDVCYETRATR